MDEDQVVDGSLFPLNLELLPISFSFSKYLAGIGSHEGMQAFRSEIIAHKQVLDPVHYIVLGLNEECRSLTRGCFYHLPLRETLDFGHPCDIAFIDEDWNHYDCKVWDAMNWNQRLVLCSADKKIHGSEEVIPICARILEHDVIHTMSAAAQLSAADEGQTRKQSISYKETRNEVNLELLSSSAQSSTQSLTLMSSSLSLNPANITYSRPLEDISTYLIHYQTIGSCPLVCMSGAAEHESICERFPTPGEISETFVRRSNLTLISDNKAEKNNASGSAEIAARAANMVLNGNAYSTLEVVLQLLGAWNDRSEVVVQDVAHFGRIKYLWSELENRMHSDRSLRDIKNMDFWPKV